MPATPPPGSTTGSPRPADGAALEAERLPLWRKRSAWIGLAVAIAALALAYGIGRAQGAMALRDAEERHAAVRASCESKLATCAADRDLLAAHRSLSLVAISLDRRNFGVAESHRRDALRALAQPSLQGIAAAPEVAATIEALDLGVDPNPGTKRDRVIAAAERLDDVLKSRAPDAPAAPAASGARTP